MGTNTPWGTSQSSTKIACGIMIYSTAGHGGIHLSPTRNALVHEAWRDDKGWYEEDCEVYIVGVTFPDEIAAWNPNWTAADSHAGAKRWFPDQYEKVFDVTVTADESLIRAEQLFYAAHAEDWVVTAAWGDWQDGVPAGMVGVVACIGGRAGGGDKRYFLIPKDEYADRGQHPFVIDPARHQQVPDFTGSGARTKQVA